MKLSLSKSGASSPAWLDNKLSEKLESIAASLGHSHSTVDVILVDDEYIRRINREFRGLDRATDVISFSYIDDSKSVPEGDALAGEIFVSCQTLEREAKSQGIRLKNLFLRAGVHGMLHVLGYDHDTDAGARTMEGEEKRLLLDQLTPSEVEELF